MTSDDIERQTGAAAGLWTHTPVDWAENEGTAKPGPWPLSASLGKFSTTTGTRPGTPGAPASPPA